MGADLTYTCLGGNQYQVSFSFYQDCSGITPSTSYSLPVTSSCGSTTVMVNLMPGYPVEVSPLCAAQLPQSTCNPGGTLPGVQHWFYQGVVTLPAACADWVFSFSECCRNSSITTLSSPGGESLYIQATLNNVAAPCNSSPNFTTLPVPYICAGQNYIYNHGAVDSDGDSLVYTLVDALSGGVGFPVVYGAGFSGTNPMNSTPPVAINSSNGNVTMMPNAPQVGVVAVRVDEYRNGVLIGSSIRDIQITVLNCTNNTPVINALSGVTGGAQTGPYSVQVCPGQALSFTIPGTDSDAGQTVAWSWNNGIPGGVFTGPSGSSPQSATFSWTPTAADAGLNSLTITLEDNACPVLGQQTRAIDILVLQGTSAGPDQGYCPSGGPIPINAIGGTAFTWTTLSGDPGGLSCFNCASPNASPSVTSTYIVQSNLPGLCKNRDTITINVVPNFSLAMGGPLTLCQGGSTSLSAVPSPAGSYTYLWSPGTALSATNVSNPSANPTTTTTYNVTVTSAAGCRMPGSQTVTVSNSVLSTAPTANPTQSCAGAPVTLNANVSSGDCNQYTVSSISVNTVGGGGWTNVTLSDDQLTGAIPIGFPFTFFCNTYNDIYISSNAFVTFDPGSGPGCCSGQNIPSTSTPNNAIFVHHEDYAGNTPRYKTIGTAPNRQFIVHYNGAAHLSGGGTALEAQVILYETSNIVEVHIVNAGTDGTGETEGIENGAGTAAFPVPGRNAVAWSATNSAHRFSPVPPLPFTVNWQAPLGSTVATGTSTSVTPATSTTYFAVVSNGVCSATAPISVAVASASAGPDQNVCPIGGNANLLASYTGPPPPSNCNIYTVSNIPFAPAAAGGTAVSLGDDMLSGALPIGFTFNFFCVDKTTAYISSNGFLTFNPTSGSGCCSGQTLPDVADPNDLIALGWDDLNPGSGGSITYQTLGTAPNRRFVVTFTGVPLYASASPDINSQIILYETTNIIEIHTTSINGISPGTQGIENSTGSAAYVVPGRNAGAWSATNDAYRFSPQVSAITYSWSPATGLSSTTVANPTAIGVSGNITYTVTVNNGTCVLTDQVNVTICLPVDFVHLVAQAEGEDVRITWDAQNEQNLDRYAVERSTGDGNWVNVGEMDAVGLPGAEQSYTTFDRSPLMGLNQYRLRIIDLNGAEAFSNMDEVTFEGREHVFVTPNPSSGLFQFEVEVIRAGKVDIDVFSTDGKSLRSYSQYLDSPGRMIQSVDLRDLPAGSYFFRAKTASGQHSGRLVRLD